MQRDPPFPLSCVFLKTPSLPWLLGLCRLAEQRRCLALPAAQPYNNPSAPISPVSPPGAMPRPCPPYPLASPQSIPADDPPPAPHTYEDRGRKPVVDQPVAHGSTSPCLPACACCCLPLPAPRFMEAAGGAAAPATGTAPRGLSPEKPLRKCRAVSKAIFQEGRADPIGWPAPKPAPRTGQVQGPH